MTDTEATLPDLLAPNLDILFVGINPSRYSVEQGHYFARKINRFWPCFSQSRLSAKARAGLGVTALLPVHDSALPNYGFGFTDLVKRATANASELAPVEFVEAVATLKEKIEAFHPRIACFHGVTAFRPLHEALTGEKFAGKHGGRLGVQDLVISGTKLFVVPNPSPANSHFTPAEQTEWYDRLADFSITKDI